MVNIHVNDNSNQIRINVPQTNNSVAAETKSPNNNVSSTIGNETFYNGLAKEWAISPDLVQGIDYSSKYYAAKAKEAISGAQEYVDAANEAANNAAESALDALTSAGLAQQYAQEALTAMLWVKINYNDWIQTGTGYTFIVNKPLGVAGVYRGSIEDKELVENIDVTITTTSVIIFSLDRFDGFILGTTAVITDEQDLSDVYDKKYTHTQAIASDEWEIVHNLNKVPSVMVTDSSGNVQVPDEIYVENINRITLTFLAPFSGMAYLN